MKLNLDFYNGKDSYSDGDIEDKIINYIRKSPNGFDNVIIKDKSWPVFYHLSKLRENVISWYPFKKDSSVLEVGAGMGALTSFLCKKCKSVTSIELSKKRATAILERNKSAKNLDIIVGNFKDIKINKKFDYILLCGVLEYGALYMDSDNPYVDFINKLKEYLNPNGKILIAIENRLGIKYLCGAAEEHLDIPFAGVNNYSNDSKIITFSKPELEELAKNVKMNINFYYMFPDYKFPQILLTDESLKKIIDFSYMPYYYRKMDLVINEHQLFNDIKANKLIPNFANSYFIELSEKESLIEVEYAKFNIYRKLEYNLFTYLKDDKFYKAKACDEAQLQIDKIIDIEKKLSKSKIEHIEVIKEKDTIYTKASNLKTLDSVLDKALNNNDIKTIYSVYDKLYEYFKTISGDIVKNDNTIFEKYGVKITKEEKNKMHFYKQGFIDIIPSNILVDKDKFILFDQEWYEENIPIEYLMFRAISYYFELKGGFSSYQNVLYKKYKINYRLCKRLENKMVLSLHSDIFRNVYKKFIKVVFLDDNEMRRRKEHVVNLEKINEKLTNDLHIFEEDRKKSHNEITRLNNVLFDVERENEELKNKIENDATELKRTLKELDEKKSRLNEIVNSKGYKILEKVYKIENKLKRK